jgi:NAD(P)-dependent dehydrogenase (short-subunit alcohol dehydrogenase family)
MPFIGAYVTSKFALEGAVDIMRREAAPQGVKISLIEPGAIKTPMVDAQITEVSDRLAALTGAESERYGYLYKAFKVMATQSHHGTASSPEAIAKTVIEAFTVDNPAPRYIAGDDAQQVIDLAKGGDEQLDQAFTGMYAQAAAAA